MPSLLDLKMTDLSCSTALWVLAVAASVLGIACIMPGVAAALERSQESKPDNQAEEGRSAMWEVRGNSWHRYIAARGNTWQLDRTCSTEAEAAALIEQGPMDAAETTPGAATPKGGIPSVEKGIQTLRRFLLPEGFPTSVTEDYAEYTSWRALQVVMSQINGVLTTQALLYAVGLGKGAIPTAAAINWVLRDGIGYLSKIALSKYGRHFDVHPKGWRLFADLVENASYGLELLTPTFPHLFIFLGAAAGAGRSACGLIQAATRNCFYAGFAMHRNFAEIIAKGEAQGMLSKSVGIGLGILVSSRVGHSGPALTATFLTVAALHMFCNLQSYQAVMLRTLNLYRAELVVAEFKASGRIASVKDVNTEEPIFPMFPWLNLGRRNCQDYMATTLSAGTRAEVAEMHGWVELGSSLADVVRSREEAETLLDLYCREEYLLTMRDGRARIVLKEGASQRDMLRAVAQATCLAGLLREQQRWSQSHAEGNANEALAGWSLGPDWSVIGESYSWMDKTFESLVKTMESSGWVAEGLIARPGPLRVHLERRDKVKER